MKGYFECDRNGYNFYNYKCMHTNERKGSTQEEEIVYSPSGHELELFRLLVLFFEDNDISYKKMYNMRIERKLSEHINMFMQVLRCSSKDFFDALDPYGIENTFRVFFRYYAIEHGILNQVPGLCFSNLKSDIEEGRYFGYK